jgi:hypothetical protein
MSIGLIGNAVTAMVTLIGVALGGWVSVRSQDRLWRRDHARQWRDIRLSVYRDFLTAYREYVAFIQEPTAKITAAPHPRNKGEMMPFFDKNGLPYRERLEATRMAATLVSERSETRDAVLILMRRARNLAASRAKQAPSEMPSEMFEALFAAQDAFERAARCELGLTDSLD